MRRRYTLMIYIKPSKPIDAEPQLVYLNWFYFKWMAIVAAWFMSGDYTQLQKWKVITVDIQIVKV